MHLYTEMIAYKSVDLHINKAVRSDIADNIIMRHPLSYQAQPSPDCRRIHPYYAADIAMLEGM